MLLSRLSGDGRRCDLRSDLKKNEIKKETITNNHFFFIKIILAKLFQRNISYQHGISIRHIPGCIKN